MQSSISVFREIVQQTLSGFNIRTDEAEFIYIVLLLPALLAGTVTVQGVGKMLRKEQDGGIITFLGLLFFGLIAGAYALFVER